jgi:hypothetical protein
MAVDNTHNSVDETNDLGRARFDHDTAAVGDRDNAFWTNGYVSPPKNVPDISQQRLTSHVIT